MAPDYLCYSRHVFAIFEAADKKRAFITIIEMHKYFHQKN